ncbi:hypothetical protein QCA50_007929 [Cerrena zonata]|uniref:Uncharacterized protein n=1 Tax=Cerrena zonata TaxID=2478898 RepID=A0AAW0GGK2_9APHY
MEMVRQELEGRERHRLNFIGRGDYGHAFRMVVLIRDHLEWGKVILQKTHTKLNKTRKREGLPIRRGEPVFISIIKESAVPPEYDVYRAFWDTEADSITRHHSLLTLVVESCCALGYTESSRTGRCTRNGVAFIF